MGKSVFNNMNLTDMSYLLDPDAFADLEKTDDKEEILLAVDQLIPFKDHPFHVDTKCEEFEQLVQSVKEYGVISPILVRPAGECYEILAGHRRVAACRAAGVQQIPAIIRALDDYEATIVMVHSNFYREKISISEKAKAYRMCMDAESHQGKKGMETAELAGGGTDSKRQVYRYVRLSYLSEGYFPLLDSGKMPMNTGVELSYLDNNAQNLVLNVLNDYGVMPSCDQAKMLKDMYLKGEKISSEGLLGLLAALPKEKKTSSVSFKTKQLRSYFDDNTKPEQMQNVIIKLLEAYKAGRVSIEDVSED